MSWRDRGTAWMWQGHGMLCVNRPLAAILISTLESRLLQKAQPCERGIVAKIKKT